MVRFHPRDRFGLVRQQFLFRSRQRLVLRIQALRDMMPVPSTNGIKIRLIKFVDEYSNLIGGRVNYVIRANVIFEQYDKRIWFYGLYNGFLYVKDDLIPIFGFSLICGTSSVRFFSVFWLVDFTCADLIFPRHLSNAQIRPKIASRSWPSSPDEFSLSISPLTSL